MARIGVVGGLGVLLGAALVFWGGTQSTNAANPTVTVAAEADASVAVSSPSANYGTSTALRIDGSPLQRAFLRFTVAGLPGPAARATLRLYATSSSRVGLTVRGVTDNTWTEKAITWSNAPPVAAAATGSTGGFSGGWVAVDVTPLVTGNGQINLAVTSSSTTAVGLRSREAGASTAPQLVIEAQTAPPPVATAPANTAVPTIGGTAEEGQQVTADPGTWSGTAPITLAYEWLACDSGGRGCTAIAGAAAASYSIPAGDVGSALRVAVTGTNDAGSSTATSAATAAVVAAPPPPPPPPTPPGGADPVVAAAGDIACTSPPLTSGTSCHYGLTAAAVASDPAITDALTLGDTQYECGDYANFLRFYDPTWGVFRSRTHPAIGNHEYLSAPVTAGCDPAATTAAKGYFDYWNGIDVRSGPAGDRTEGYYSYDVGSWHLVALNSNCSKIGGCGPGSPQETWLRSDLAAHSGACTLAYWHHPRFSSGLHGNTPAVAPLWEALYAAGADVVLNGHDHDYERFGPQTPGGAADSASGIREFVVGTGGKNHYAFGTTQPNSEVRDASTFGILKLTLHATSYDWQFVPASAGGFTDSGSGPCHGAPVPPA